MTREAASIPLGMVRSVRKTSTKQGHVKYAGLQLGTIHKYNLAINRFFVWLSSAEKALFVSLAELDEAIGEYVNHLCQDDLPVGWASDVVCGFKCFYPKCRKSLQISGGYLRNWNKSVSRTQALPLTSDILMLLVVSLMRGETRLALAFLFGFTCLLRTGEIVSLTRRQATFLGGGTQLHIALPGSKGATRLGRPESVMLKQPHIAKFIAKAVEHMGPSEFTAKLHTKILRFGSLSQEDII